MVSGCWQRLQALELSMFLQWKERQAVVKDLVNQQQQWQLFPGPVHNPVAAHRQGALRASGRFL